MQKERRQGEVSSGAYKQRTEAGLVLGGFVLILVVGGILMTLLMGTGPAALGIGIILLLGTVLIALYLGLGALESWLKRQD